MVLQKRVWRMLRENKGRYIGIVLLILIGSFYFTAATGVAGSLEDQVVHFAQTNMQEDLTFSTDKTIEDLPTLARESGAVIEPYQQRDVKLPDGQSELRLLTPTSTINIPTVLSGQPLNNPGDIVLDPIFLRTHGLAVGGQLELNGKIFHITGTMALPNYVYIIKNLYDVLPTAGFGIALVSSADMEMFPNAAHQAVTVYGARFTKREDVDTQSAKLHGLLQDKGYSLSEWLDAKNNKRISSPWANITSLQSFSFPVSIAFFLLSCIIVGVTMLRMVKSDAVVIGTLYAQGYRRRELTRHYLAIPVLLSITGGLLGILLAWPCIGLAVDSILATYILPNTGIAFSPFNLALALLLPLALIGLASFFSLRGVLKKSAAELMKGDEQKARVNFFERVLRLERFRFTTKFQIREQVRSIPRLLFLLLGVSIASLVLLYGLTFNSSMDVAMKQGAVARYNYGIEYNFKEMQNLHDRPVPTGAEPYNSFRAYPEGRDEIEFYVLGMEPDSVGLKVNGIGGAKISRNQVNITSSLAQRLGLGVGDTLTCINKLDEKSYRLKIDGIIEAYGEQYVFLPLDEFNQKTGQAPGSYRTVLSNHVLNYDESLLAGVLDVRDPTKFANVSASTTLIVTATTSVAVLLAVVIIFIVSSLIIDENWKTISLLKIFGYYRKDIAKLILNSSTPVVFLGFGLGLLLMVALGNYLFSSIADSINMLIPMTLNPVYVLLSLVLILVVYEITKWFCGRKISLISMSEALKAGSE
ncbi:FtsX-like permease family protein [Tengunoibacter tsumagoiensis]|uniref:ABC transporter permease n=1 Tax=Tengunoibacter tsumagoiensis TaxID=2014871 RepID=A0A402A867_9CHLR|nr:FtsX-like permease family protein [Tengunoibacter tsumagoiensis]GCE15344.1 ABC transporter permease [Tengunoibacter tsumagoiensis]